MAKQVTIRQMVQWLTKNGFVELPGKKSGHRQFSNKIVKIAIPGHGPTDITKKQVGMILRVLEQSGFDRHQLKELRHG